MERELKLDESPTTLSSTSSQLSKAALTRQCSSYTLYCSKHRFNLQHFQFGLQGLKGSYDCLTAVMERDWIYFRMSPDLFKISDLT